MPIPISFNNASSCLQQHYSLPTLCISLRRLTASLPPRLQMLPPWQKQMMILHSRSCQTPYLLPTPLRKAVSCTLRLFQQNVASLRREALLQHMGPSILCSFLRGAMHLPVILALSCRLLSLVHQNPPFVRQTMCVML